MTQKWPQLTVDDPEERIAELEETVAELLAALGAVAAFLECRDGCAMDSPCDEHRNWYVQVVSAIAKAKGD